MENSGKHCEGAILRENITCMANGWLKEQDEQCDFGRQHEWQSLESDN